MKIKVSDYLVRRLTELGITDVFGLPGDYNFNILDAVIKNSICTRLLEQGRRN